MLSVQEKASLDKIYEKYYGKGSKAKQESAKIKEVMKGDDRPARVVIDDQGSPREGIIPAAGSTRNEIMMMCKEKGIKNFRVLNKQEMLDILADIGNQKKIDAIVTGAVARWKQGWGAKAREAGKDHKE